MWGNRTYCPDSRGTSFAWNPNPPSVSNSPPGLLRLFSFNGVLESEDSFHLIYVFSARSCCNMLYIYAFWFKLASSLVLLVSLDQVDCALFLFFFCSREILS